MHINKIYKKNRWIKFLLIFSTLILQTPCFFSCQSKEPVKKPTQKQGKDPVVAEILALEKMRLDATTQFDSVKLKQLLAPEFELTTAQGELLNTQKMLQVLKKRSQAQIQEQHSTQSQKVQLLNDNSLAIVKGVYLVERKDSRGLVVLTLRYSDLYVKNSNNIWLLMCSHLSRIAR